MKSHWESIYTQAAINQLGWYEENPAPSLQLINQCKLDTQASILQVGAGATTLVDKLLEQGYTNLIANDLSQTALQRLQERLGSESSNVQWMVDDLIQPTKLQHIEPIDLWHDRAVLHFFTDKKDQDTYFSLVKRLVKHNGFVIIAVFALEGAEKCSRLPVHRYDANMLQERLGEDFELIEKIDSTYHMPSGDTRAYIYTLFKRKSE